MHTETFEITGRADSHRASRQLNVVIAYADFSSVTLARQILKESLPALASHFVVNTTFWKFELLDFPRLRQIATEDAAQAQIIIISAHKEYGLPEGAKNWVESCLTNPAVKDVAFVGVVKDEELLPSYGDSLPEDIEQFPGKGRSDVFWFIANENDGQKPAADKIIQLACQHPAGHRAGVNQ